MLSLFGLSPTFNEVQLKEAYKRLIAQYHPDKTQRVTTAPMIQMLTQFYRHLKEHLDERQVQVRPMDRESLPPSQSQVSSNKRFDVHLFNKIFEKYSIKDTQEDGYGDWREKSSSLKEKSTHATQVYKEPQPYLSGADEISCYELGVKKIGDYSAQNNGSLHFTDYKLAHTTDRIVDPFRVQARKQYTTVDDLKLDRANISHTMSPKELSEYIRKQRDTANKEKERLAFMQQRDNHIARQFENLSSVQALNSLR